MNSIRKVLVLGFITVILFGFLYPLLMVAVGKLMPNRAAGMPVFQEGKLIGFENIGQPFYSQKYFWGRPSAVKYNAAATGGSNYGTSNPALLKRVQNRVDTLLKYNPGIEEKDIPVELITASGSGLDPDISKEGALIQVKRIAKARNLPVEEVRNLINSQTNPAFLGFLGPKNTINVLQLNIALDKLEQAKR